MPTLNAEDHLARTLSALVPGVVEGVIKEVVIVDGGSDDATLEIADSTGCRIVNTDHERGLQLWQGCREARGDWLLILHSDSQLGEGWMDQVQAHMKHYPLQAGYFHLRFDDPSILVGLWAEMLALRARWLAMPSGDHGLLLSRALYDSIGGYKDQVAFEDVALSMALGRARLRPMGASLTTNATRFHARGALWRGIAKSFGFLAYMLGVPPKPPKKA
ncbi:MAG: glycosyltransferase [Asticcacaulis sp.]|uniref:glycosyltransferase n=1 Tax=Asticcacaulis sp. TaxID=1872648 RepID=UPI0039E6D017